MPTRDFIVLPTAMPAGTELTMDRASAGWELSCSICKTVTAREEPGTRSGDLRKPRYAVGLQVSALIPEEGHKEARIPLDLCEACAESILAPFAPFLESNGLSLFHRAAEPAPDVDVDAHAGGQLVAADH